MTNEDKTRRLTIYTELNDALGVDIEEEFGSVYAATLIDAVGNLLVKTQREAFIDIKSSIERRLG